MELRDLVVYLEQEYDYDGFLGVNLERDIKTGLLHMKKNGLTTRIIEALVLDDGMSKDKFTTSEAKPLVKDENGEPASGMFGYSSVAGMILYMSRNMHPYVSLAVNFFSQYMLSPKISRILALERLAY